MRFPESLTSEARVTVVAPSGPFDPAHLRGGIERLAPHFQLALPRQLFREREGFLAGGDCLRLAELQAALDDPECKAIWVARGGYGLSRISPRIDWTTFAAHPKWIIGFSDVTVLHCRLAQLQVASIHGPNATTLAEASSEDVEGLIRLLQGSNPRKMRGLAVLATGSAEGPLVGGNLTVLFAEAAAGQLSIPEGAILLLEDVTETSYRIDRMLTALNTGGYLRRCAGIVLGTFTDCSAGKFDVPVEAVLRDRLAHLGIPVLYGLPVGHGPANAPLVLGARARICARTASLTFCG